MNIEIVEEVTLTKRPNGMIEVVKYTVYLKPDGSELQRENPWRRTLAPGDFEGAEDCLSHYDMNIVREIWTDEVIEAYRQKEELRTT